MDLRDYQIAGRDRIAEIYSYGHSRATLVLPCGTGKTVVAADLIPTQPRCATAFFVPTIALLHQTWVALAGAHPKAELLGVCSATTPATTDADDMTIAAATRLLGGRLTTDLDAITEHLTNRTAPLVLIATYASSPLVADAVTRSHTTFNLLVCDEAHRTAGTADKMWATPVHGIPTRRLLFMTATPRTIVTTDTSDPNLDTAEIVSMNSLADYGPHITPIGFRDAITAGYLADYEIAVIGVNHRQAWNQLALSATTTGHRASHAATHQALINAAETHNLRSILVFHNRITDSQQWTQQLQETAAARAIPLQAHHLDGSTPTDQRNTILNQLSNPGDTLTVVSNCRVFAEGIDVPELDAVMFAAPRTAGPDIIQIVGRAIRPHPHRRHQKALIILPIFDHADDLTDLETKAARTSHLAAWQVLTALAEEDELLHDSLAQWRDYIENNDPPTEPQNNPVTVDLTTLTTTGAAFFLKTLARTSSPHLTTAARLRAFHARYGHTRVAPQTIFDGFPLADRLAAARAAYRAGRMHPRVAIQFETIPGFAWTIRSSAQRRTPQEWIALISHYINTTGVHTITRDAWITDPATNSRANIGRWLHVDAAKPRYLTAGERDELAKTGYRRP